MHFIMGGPTVTMPKLSLNMGEVMDKWGQLVCTKVFILALCCHPKKAPINMPYPHTLSTCPIHTRYQYKLSTHRINTPFPVSFALHSLLSHLSCTLSTHPINAPYQRTHPISTHILSINTHILSTLTPYHHPPPPLYQHRASH